MSDTTRLTDQQLDAIEATYTESRVSTHYQGCEVDHPFCAVRMLAVEVRALKAGMERIAGARCLEDRFPPGCSGTCVTCQARAHIAALDGNDPLNVFAGKP